MRVAEHHLREAREALRRGVFFDCAFHSASAAENATNALILHLGGVLPRTHRNADALRAAALGRRPELLEEEDFKLLLEKAAVLEGHIVKSRYPIKIREGKFATPDEYYKRKDAERMFADARFVVDTIKRLIAGPIDEFELRP